MYAFYKLELSTKVTEVNGKLTEIKPGLSLKDCFGTKNFHDDINSILHELVKDPSVCKMYFRSAFGNPVKA